MGVLIVIQQTVGLAYLAVVNGEGNGQHILGVANETAGGVAGVEVPQAQGSVPGARQGELAIRGDHHVLNEVGVAGEGTEGLAVVALLAGQGPLDDALVTVHGIQSELRAWRGPGAMFKERK